MTGTRAPREVDGVRLESIDARSISDDDGRGVWAIDVACHREAGLLEVLVEPLDKVVAEIRHQPAETHLRMSVARGPAGRIAAYAWCAWEDVPSNRNRSPFDVRVHPDERGSGLGRALLCAVLAAAHDFGTTSLIAEARVDGVGVGFLERFGFTRRLVYPLNVWWTRDADRSLLTGWVEAGRRAADYSLVAWDGPVPTARLDDFADLWHVMNTAPTDDLDWDDEVMTPNRVRSFQASLEQRSIDQWTVVARHHPTGDLVGFTEMRLLRNWPAVVVQGDTGVRPEHRRNGLGRWLKAANALRLLDEMRGVEAVTTWNAASNDDMLSINHAMGFVPVEHWAEWQADVVDVEEALERS